MKNLKRIASLLLVLALMGSTLVGCSSSSSDEVPTITWVTTGDAASVGIEDDDRIVEYINELLGVNLEVTYVAEGNSEAVNLIMATGDLPDIVTGSYGSSATQSWIDDDLIAPITDYIDDYESIAASVYTDYSWTAIDGEYYGVPFITQLNAANGLIAMRGDWLDTLGLEYPTTIDEMTEVLTAFTYDDPDGNGIDDTYGFTAQAVSSDNTNFDWAFYAYGLEYADYALDADGNVIAKFEDEAWAEGMQYLADLWSAGVIDNEFMLNSLSTDQSEKFYNGTVGATPLAFYRNLTVHTTGVSSVYEDAYLVYGTPPEGDDGSYGLNAQGKSGLITCVTSTSENVEKALEVIDFFLSEDGQDLMRNGIEGIHYTEEDGVITYDLEERELDAFSADGWAHALAWGSLFWPLDENYLPEGTDNGDEMQYTVELASDAQVENLIKQTTDVEIEYSDALDDLYVEYFLKMLQGEMTVEEGIDSLTTAWYAQGGTEVIASANETYAAMNG